MNRPTKIAIIGGGGIACALLPALSRLADTVIVDGDNYEPENSSRQFPALHSRANKAAALMELLQPNTLHRIDAIGEYLKDGRVASYEDWRGTEMVVGAVDNTASRRIIVELCSDLEIPAILGGNEHAMGEAHLFIPEIYNPFDHFDFSDSAPTPWACNSDKQIELEPQTPLANFMAASAIMHLLLSWESASKPENAVAHTRLDVFSSTSSRVKNILAANLQPQQA